MADKKRNRARRTLAFVLLGFLYGTPAVGMSTPTPLGGLGTSTFPINVNINFKEGMGSALSGSKTLLSGLWKLSDQHAIITTVVASTAILGIMSKLRKPTQKLFRWLEEQAPLPMKIIRPLAAMGIGSGIAHVIINLAAGIGSNISPEALNATFRGAQKGMTTALGHGFVNGINEYLSPEENEKGKVDANEKLVRDGIESELRKVKYPISMSRSERAARSTEFQAYSSHILTDKIRRKIMDAKGNFVLKECFYLIVAGRSRTGKSHDVEELAQLLGVPLYTINGSTVLGTSWYKNGAGVKVGCFNDILKIKIKKGEIKKKSMVLIDEGDLLLIKTQLRDKKAGDSKGANAQIGSKDDLATSKGIMNLLDEAAKEWGICFVLATNNKIEELPETVTNRISEFGAVVEKGFLREKHERKALCTHTFNKLVQVPKYSALLKTIKGYYWDATIGQLADLIAEHTDRCSQGQIAKRICEELLDQAQELFDTGKIKKFSLEDQQVEYLVYEKLLGVYPQVTAEIDEEIAKLTEQLEYFTKKDMHREKRAQLNRGILEEEQGRHEVADRQAQLYKTYYNLTIKVEEKNNVLLHEIEQRELAASKRKLFTKVLAMLASPFRVLKNIVLWSARPKTADEIKQENAQLLGRVAETIKHQHTAHGQLLDKQKYKLLTYQIDLKGKEKESQTLECDVSKAKIEQKEKQETLNFKLDWQTNQEKSLQGDLETEELKVRLKLLKTTIEEKQLMCKRLTIDINPLVESVKKFGPLAQATKKRTELYKKFYENICVKLGLKKPELKVEEDKPELEQEFVSVKRRPLKIIEQPMPNNQSGILSPHKIFESPERHSLLNTQPQQQQLEQPNEEIHQEGLFVNNLLFRGNSFQQFNNQPPSLQRPPKINPQRFIIPNNISSTYSQIKKQINKLKQENLD